MEVKEFAIPTPYADPSSLVVIVEINEELMTFDMAMMTLYVDCGKVNLTHAGEH